MKRKVTILALSALVLGLFVLSLLVSPASAELQPVSPEVPYAPLEPEATSPDLAPSEVCLAETSAPGYCAGTSGASPYDCSSGGEEFSPPQGCEQANQAAIMGAVTIAAEEAAAERGAVDGTAAYLVALDAARGAGEDEEIATGAARAAANRSAETSGTGTAGSATGDSEDEEQATKSETAASEDGAPVSTQEEPAGVVGDILNPSVEGTSPLVLGVGVLMVAVSGVGLLIHRKIAL